jgi:hypothetical protein
MNKQIKIGRNTLNDLVFNYQQVSGQHATLTPIGTNSIIIEDLGSSNGTFVNGIQIKRMIISQTDRVKVANILVNTTPYFTTKSNSIEPKLTKSSDPSYQKEFEKLKDIWETYQNVKLNHKKKGFWKNMGITVVGMGLGAVLLPGIGMMIGSLVGRGAAGLLKDDEKLQVVENEFKVNYVCPKCKVFLGYNPYDGLVQRQKCMTCKTNWIETNKNK